MAKSGFSWTGDGKRLMNNLDKTNGKNNVGFAGLFTDKFMKKHTKFGSIQEFTNAGEIDWQNIDREKLDKFVSDNSSFSNFGAMQAKAGAEWLKGTLFKK